VTGVAADLDRTLVARDGELRPRTVAAIADARQAGIPVVVATGRMFRSVAPYLEQAGIDDPVICYQGAAVVDPRDGTFLLHERLELDVARSAIAILEELGHPPNVYVDDELFVAHETEYSRAYSSFQHLPVTEVGDLLTWLRSPPTKLVAVGDPDALPALKDRLRERLGASVFLTTSLPHLLEVGHPGVSKGTGLAFVADRLRLDPTGLVAFGDGENDVELLEAAAFGVAVGDAHPRLLEVADWRCPGAEVEGVAGVIEAVVAAARRPVETSPGHDH
jgi:Cof subfamily protein (haloacid dehalogenase superfamily)